ncbi:DUF523 domain-containing protein [Vulgatibacter incomptus]|uniref:Purine nucleoside phosphorylase n=1 Tax=Vulgatibacter incomptus TaxID=1391653 RepID=A0A0K1P7Z3_9BACT|nr:DUF523 domain-containing protein [Vulgatibacter incomptus]AKU89632.1 Purine nucleoside phosphorylase [Vulgatibacter incomptus]
MEKILISACLLGQRVRFDGAAAQVEDELLTRWIEEGRLVAICPEVSGGLPVPRPSAELRGGSGADALDGRSLVVTASNTDVSEHFLAGARAALELAQRHRIRVAVLKDRSPSCGSLQIYDGSFTRTRIGGEGVTAALLRRSGIRVFSEAELPAAAAALAELESALSGAAPRR